MCSATLNPMRAGRDHQVSTSARTSISCEIKRRIGRRRPRRNFCHDEVVGRTAPGTVISGAMSNSCGVGKKRSGLVWAWAARVRQKGFLGPGDSERHSSDSKAALAAVGVPLFRIPCRGRQRGRMRGDLCPLRLLRLSALKMANPLWMKRRIYLRTYDVSSSGGVSVKKNAASRRQRPSTKHEGRLVSGWVAGGRARFRSGCSRF